MPRLVTLYGNPSSVITLESVTQRHKFSPDVLLGFLPDEPIPLAGTPDFRKVDYTLSQDDYVIELAGVWTAESRKTNIVDADGRVYYYCSADYMRT